MIRPVSDITDDSDGDWSIAVYIFSAKYSNSLFKKDEVLLHSFTQ